MRVVGTINGTKVNEEEWSSFLRTLKASQPDRTLPDIGADRKITTDEVVGFLDRNGDGTLDRFDMAQLRDPYALREQFRKYKIPFPSDPRPIIEERESLSIRIGGPLFSGSPLELRLEHQADYKTGETRKVLAGQIESDAGARGIEYQTEAKIGSPREARLAKLVADLFLEPAEFLVLGGLLTVGVSSYHGWTEEFLELPLLGDSLITHLGP